MNILLALFVTFSVLSLGFIAHANAETLKPITLEEWELLPPDVKDLYEIYVVPVEFPVGDIRMQSSFVNDIPVKKIIIEGIPTNSTSAQKVWDFEDREWKTIDDAQPEEAIPTCKESDTCIPEEETVELTYWEEKAQSLEHKTKGSNIETLRERLDKMVGSLCYGGTGRAAATQSFHTWDIPTEMVPDGKGGSKMVLALDYEIKSKNLKGLLGQIERAIEWCKGQNILLNDILTDADLMAGYLDKKPFRYHSDDALSIPIWSQDRVNQEANMNMDKNSLDRNGNDVVCQGYYSHTTKKAYGCITIYPPSIHETPKQHDYHSESYKLWKEYNDGNEEAQRLKIVKEKLARDYIRYR